MSRFAQVGAMMLLALGFVTPAGAAGPVGGPQYETPYGLGSGVVGFGFAAPGPAGNVYTSNGSGEAPSFKPPTSTLRLVDFGFKADGATDNTAAVNSAIAAAVADGGNVTLMAPQGTGLIGQANTILANNVWFGCEGAPGTCIFKATASGEFQWSNTTQQVTGGGIYGITLAGNSLATQTLIALPQVFMFALQNDYLDVTVGGLLNLGTASTQASGVYIENVIGGVANVAAPLIKLNSGAGLFVSASSVYSDNVIGAANGARNFISGGTFSWDTISVRSSYIYKFNAALATDVASGAVVGDISFSGNWLDELNTSFYIVTESGGSIGSFVSVGDELTGKTTDCAQFVGTGTNGNVIFSGDDFRECQNNGAYFGSAVVFLTFIGNTIKSTDVSGGTYRGLYVVNGTNVVVNGNQVGIDVGDGHVPTYGMEFDACSGCVITSNRAHGSSANFILGTITGSSMIAGNPDLPAVTATITVGASPFTHTAGARPETDCVHGGAVTDVAMNGFDTGQVAGCFALGANETLQVSYTSAPIILVTQH